MKPLHLAAIGAALVVLVLWYAASKSCTVCKDRYAAMIGPLPGAGHGVEANRT